MSQIAFIVLELARFLFRVLILIFCGQMLRATARALQGVAPRKEVLRESWPEVRVRLQTRYPDENLRRLLRTVRDLDYPEQSLKIELWISASDKTDVHKDEVLQSLGDDGVEIQWGPCTAPKAEVPPTEEFVVILDGNSQPHPRFLKHALGAFSNTEVGVVRAPWLLTNRDNNILARLQGILHDAFRVIEQPQISLEALPSPLGGTPEVWRRACLEEVVEAGEPSTADNWRHLLRVSLTHWRVVNLSTNEATKELPETMWEFRQQQREICSKSLGHLATLLPTLRTRPGVWRQKSALITYLGRHWVYPLILVTCLTSPLATFYEMPFLIHYGLIANAALLTFVLSSILVYFGVAIWKSRTRISNILLIPTFLPLAAGMSLTYSVGIIEGLWSIWRSSADEPKPAPEHTEGSRFDWTAYVEIAVALYHASALYLSLTTGHIGESLFFLLVSLGFGWVGIASLYSGSQSKEALK